MQIKESHKLFSRIGKIAAAGYSVEDTVTRIMNEIIIYFEPIHCSLLRVDSNSKELFFAFMRDNDLEKVNKIRLQMGEGIAGMVALSQKPYFISDTSKDPNFSTKVDELTGFATKSIIAVPLVYNKKTYGVIEIVNNTNEIPYTENDLLILQTIADFAAISLYNAELFEQLRTQAHHDPLTCLFNRTRLNIELGKFSAAPKRDRRENDKKITTVILIDLDKFKIINDSMGHSAGDSVLKDFSSRLHSIVRNQDLIFRIGGDEFLIIIYSENQHDSTIVHDRLCAEFERLKTKTTSFEIPYNFSYGIACGMPFALEDLINLADEYMYNNKSVSENISVEN